MFNWDLQQIDHIIFDFGGVLLDIDYDKTTQAFEALSSKPFKAFTQKYQAELFCKHECGAISDEEFRDGVRENLEIEAEDSVIDSAWNAMLGKLPARKLELVEKLKQDFGVYLLSNTNSIHQKAFEDHIDETFGLDRFYQAFDKIYYSHKLGARKPHPETFQMVVQRLNVDPKHTLFIDDSPQHVEGAVEIGLCSYHLKPGESILDLIGK